ncbi:hypothetical protein [Methanimicrococcus hongohii]|uniref:hypothetical protein n=1 Tax=Methanimicrococcus hongohii TaxID=3028295 RepID=UPI00292E591C|nr:hypothetical protein [Methanimicrococcus sp. Hf6]
MQKIASQFLWLRLFAVGGEVFVCSWSQVSVSDGREMFVCSGREVFMKKSQSDFFGRCPLSAAREPLHFSKNESKTNHDFYWKIVLK